MVRCVLHLKGHTVFVVAVATHGWQDLGTSMCSELFWSALAALGWSGWFFLFGDALELHFEWFLEGMCSELFWSALATLGYIPGRCTRGSHGSCWLLLASPGIPWFPAPWIPSSPPPLGKNQQILM